MENRIPVTVIVAVRNESSNLRLCLPSLQAAERIIVVDSNSDDGSERVAKEYGAEVIQFQGGDCYPKKRQWVLDRIPIHTPWVMFVDADEIVGRPLWDEIAPLVTGKHLCSAYIVRKRMHFLGKKIRFGGFSHSAVFLGKYGRIKFEELLIHDPSGLDMEVHERIIVDGDIGRLKKELHHEDGKSLSSYLEKHNSYSTWEAMLRHGYNSGARYGKDTIRPDLFGNVQERRRFLKMAVMRLPFEPIIWFLFHYLICLGFLEGRRGWILCRIRWNYIFDVRSKMYELQRKLAC